VTEKGALCIPSAVKNLDAGLKIYVEKHGSEAIALFDASSVGQLDVAETRFDLDGKVCVQSNDEVDEMIREAEFVQDLPQGLPGNSVKGLFKINKDYPAGEAMFPALLQEVFE
jgi:hypothetical protein